MIVTGVVALVGSITVFAPSARSWSAGASAGFVAPTDFAVRIPPRAAIKDPLQLANWWRTFAGRYPDGAPLTPLAWDSTLAQTAQNHVDYLAYLRTVGSDYCGHSTDPAHPPLTDVSRSHNVLFCGLGALNAIDGWVNTPLHGEFFFDTRTTTIGEGTSTAASAAGFVKDYSSTNRDVSVFPAPNGVMPYMRWWGGETPDPSLACPPDTSTGSGAVNGEPIMISLPSATVPQKGYTTPFSKVVAWSLTDSYGNTVPACMMSFDQVAPIDGVVDGNPYIFPKVPFVNGGSYHVTAKFRPYQSSNGVPVDFGQQQTTLDWSFTAIDFRSPPQQRLFDSRTKDFTFKPGGDVVKVVTLQVGGVDGVPPNAAAVAMNVTAVLPGGSGYVTVWPCGQPQPLASNLNYGLNQTVPNLVVSKLGDGGKVCMFTSKPADLVVDLQGWFPDGYQAVTPVRILETRPTQPAAGIVPAGKLAHDGVIALPVAGTFGVPGSAPAVVFNVTVTEPDGPGFVTVWPCGQPQPLASNLNFVAGQTVANLVVAKPGTDGNVCISASNSAHLIADLQGWFPAGYESVIPRRVLETRSSTTQIGYSGPKPPAGSVTKLSLAGVVPSGVSAVVLNVTVTNPEGPGFATVWPCDRARPTASNLNFDTGQTTPNAVVVQPGSSMQVCFLASQSADFVVDLQGWRV